MARTSMGNSRIGQTHYKDNFKIVNDEMKLHQTTTYRWTHGR